MSNNNSWANALWVVGAAVIAGFVVWHIAENWTEAEKQMLTNKIGRALICAARE